MMSRSMRSSLEQNKTTQTSKNPIPTPLHTCCCYGFCGTFNNLSFGLRGLEHSFLSRQDDGACIRGGETHSHPHALDTPRNNAGSQASDCTVVEGTIGRIIQASDTPSARRGQKTDPGEPAPEDPLRA